ncbi:MAG TPA: hypothetical protein VIK45_18455 [Candidatus Dormibacteraeota bacterium]
MGSSDPPPPPNGQEVEERLIQLVAGRATPEEVADWALRWVVADHPGIDDPHIWQAIGALAGADLKTGPSTYIHGQSDFQHWLDEFRAGLALATPDPRPGRDAIEEQLLGLVNGTRTREEVANWVAPWLHADWHDVPDQRLQRAIGQLGRADLKRGPSNYLHGEADFNAWLQEFRT